jgi:hypothetical protein
MIDNNFKSASLLLRIHLDMLYVISIDSDQLLNARRLSETIHLFWLTNVLQTSHNGIV